VHSRPDSASSAAVRAALAAGSEDSLVPKVVDGREYSLVPKVVDWATAQVTGNKSALEESAEAYYAMLKHWPAHYKSWVNMANLLPALGRYDEAVTASWEGIQLAPDMCASFTRSGPCNRHRAGSVHSYPTQQATGQQSLLRHDRYARSIGILNLGNALFGSGHKRNAVRCYMTVLRLMPNTDRASAGLPRSLPACRCPAVRTDVVAVVSLWECERSAVRSWRRSADRLQVRG
jgi:hypothetical protein